MSDFTEFVKDRLDKLGLSGREFAGRVGVTQPVVSRTLSGQQGPPANSLVVWADALRLSETQRTSFFRLALSDLLEGEVFEAVVSDPVGVPSRVADVAIGYDADAATSEESVMQRFGGQVAVYLEISGLSQRGFAKKVDCSHGFVQAVCQGKNRPRIMDLPVWADELGLTEPEKLVFIRFGELLHCPIGVIREVLALEKRVEAMTRTVQDLLSAIEESDD